MLNYKADWVEVPQDAEDTHCPEYPPCGLESWHKDNGVYID